MLTGSALAPDPVLPHRDALLDPARVASMLATCLGARGALRIDGAERLRAVYRVGESLRVLHRIRVHGCWQPVSLRAFRDGRGAAAFRTAAEAAPPARGLRPVVVLPEWRALGWTFPSDRKILDLPGRLAAIRTQAAGRLRIANYKPETSVMLALPDAYAKVHADGGARARLLHVELAAQVPVTDPHLRLPRPLACAATGPTLALEALPGRRLADLRGRTLVAGLGAFGVALARFHGLRPPSVAERFARYDVPALAAAADAIAAACPGTADTARGLADVLARTLAWGNDVPVCLHGDVHPKNGLLDGARAGLVDLEDVAVGPAAADLGSCLARLRCDRLLGVRTPAATDALASAMRDGYARLRPLPASRAIAWHTAAALLVERAQGGVVRVRPAMLATLRLVLAEARHVLAVGEAG